MTKNRLENFSDGVFSILITIMVLQLRQPVTGNWNELLRPEFIDTLIAYGLSFMLIGSFWISHHQIMANITNVDRTILSQNLRAIFSITMVPFVTEWHSNFSHSKAAGVVYGFVYLWSLYSLYNLAGHVSKLVDDEHQLQIRAYNKTRLRMMAIALMGTGLSFIYPSASSWSVLVIWIFWTSLASTRWRERKAASRFKKNEQVHLSQQGDNEND